MSGCSVASRAALEARNERSGRVVASDVRATRGPWERLRGLLGRPPLEAGAALLIAPSNGIHTVGMRYAIDVIFLDRAGRVMRCVPALAPRRFVPFVRGAHAVLELPIGAIAASGTAEGDTITVAPRDAVTRRADEPASA